MINSRRRLLVLAALLPAFVAAQTPTNPNLNAQLLVAARQGDLVAVNRALGKGAAVDSRNRLGKTSLFLSAEKGRTDMAAVLLQAGANPNMASVERVTPLMAASYVGATEIVRLLLEKGAQTDLLDRMNKPAILYAAGQGHVESLRLLLDRGVPVNHAYVNQLTALMWAAGQGHVEATRLLLARGADAALRDDRGLSAADMAVKGGYTAVSALMAPP